MALKGKAPWNKGKKLKQRAASKEEVYDLYINKNLTRHELANKLGMSEVVAKGLIREYDIKKPIKLARMNSAASFKANCKHSLDKDFAKVNKDDLINYYINENHSREECCSYFDVSMNNLKTIIKEYEIVKPRELVNDTVYKVLMSKYGVATGFDVNITTSNGRDSKPNNAFKQSLIDNDIDFLQEQYVGHFRYDFSVDNLYIEINPTVTHNIDFTPYGTGDHISKDYHKKKSENVGRCIHVWDWDNIDAIITLLKKKDSVYARQCEVREVSKEDAKKFISSYHIQGYAKDSLRLGLYYKDELVSIMTFDKPRYNKSYEYEIVRYCSSMNVTGGANKLFRHFIDLTSTTNVVSYCDLSKFSGDTYEQLGFRLKSTSPPACHWVHLKTGQHFTDNLVRQRGVDQLLGTDFGKGTSNSDLLLSLGFVRVYDCGQATYVYES